MDEARLLVLIRPRAGLSLMSNVLLPDLSVQCSFATWFFVNLARPRCAERSAVFGLLDVGGVFLVVLRA